MMRQALDAFIADQRIWWGLGLLILGAGIAGIGWFGYQRYAASYNQQAQWALAQQVERFESILQSETSDAAVWRELEQGFAKGFEAHRRSTLAPLFRAYQAEAAMRAGDPVHACELLTMAINEMGKSYPLYFAYATKLYVWELDHHKVFHADPSQDGGRTPAMIKNRAIQELKALAQDGKNPDPGLAWYHLWQYGMVHNDRDLTSLAAAKLQGIAHWEYVLHGGAQQLADESLDVELQGAVA
jgi:hypothetical protein